MTRFARRVVLWLCLWPAGLPAGLFAFPQAASSVDIAAGAGGTELTLDLGEVRGESKRAGGDQPFRAGGIRLSLVIDGTGTAQLRLSAAELDLPEPVGSVKKLTLSCPRLQLSAASVSCAAGSLRLISPWTEDEQAAVSFEYLPDAGMLRLNLADLGIAGGRLRLQALINEAGERAGWQLSGDIRALRLDRLPQPLLTLLRLPKGSKLSGQVALQFELSSSDSDKYQLRADSTLQSLSLALPGGLTEAQQLSGKLSLRGRSADGREWILRSRLALDRGLLYVDPFALEVTGHPLTLQAAAAWEPRHSRLQLSHMVLAEPGRLNAEGAAVISYADGLRWESAQLRTDPAPLQFLYPTFLRPLLAGTALGSLDARGTAALDYRYGPGTAFSAKLSGVDLDESEHRFGISGLQGSIRWSSDRPARSELSWQGGHVYAIPFGASALTLNATDGRLDLAQALRLPLLDGALLVRELGVEGLMGPASMGSGGRSGGKQAGPSWRLQAELGPISMEALSERLGWPRMSGSVSATVPEVAYEGDTLKLGGAIKVRAFDGEIGVRNLRLSRPLGVAPTVNADVDATELDLYALTQAFSFGAIRGRLGGYMRSLRLEAWQPVAFDGFVYTSPHDTSQHRISQRAVETLSSLGGDGGGAGIGSAFSRAFLGLFKEFAYKRLGLRCRLENGVCEMSGIGPAPKGGYYIVEGGFGLPTIDVIGYNRRVDWDVLLERVRNAMQTKPAVQ